MRLARHAALALGLALLSFGDVARAQDAAGGQALYEAGVAAYGQGDLAKACDAFQKSFAADKQPAPLFMLAKCEEKQGKIASALDHFEEVLRLGGLEVELRDQAAQSVTSLGPRVPRVQLERGSAPASAIAKIDGIVVSLDGKPLPLDPGEHELVVEAPEFSPHTERFTAKESELSRVELRVGAPLPKPPAAVPQAPVAPPPSDASGLWIGGAVAAGVGAAGFVVAGVTGGIILDACGGSLACEDRTADSPSDGVLGANYAGWAIGGVGVATGVVLFVVAAVSEPTDASPPRAGAVRLVPGPAPLGLGGALAF